MGLSEVVGRILRVKIKYNLNWQQHGGLKGSSVVNDLS
jgi:hypothetical protein